jgi:hypothetical protein
MMRKIAAWRFVEGAQPLLVEKTQDVMNAAVTSR